jgi:hypothetical protein
MIKMTFKGQPFYYCELVGPPDRTQFIRDAEAAMRLRHPMATRRYLESLCDARARAELYRERYRTDDEREAVHSNRKRELWGICREMGFLATQISSVDFRMNFDF